MIDIKAILGSLVGKKNSSDSTESATLLVKNLPDAEYYTALVEIIKAVSKINKDATVTLKDRISTLLYVDARAVNMHNKLCKEFLLGSARSKSFLPSILAYWTELSNGYQLCLRQMQSIKNASTDSNIELLTIRALHHQLSLIKWSALRYISADGNTWQQGYRLYLFAEQQQFHAKRIALYEDHNSTTSAEELLIQAAMLHLAQTDNLLPQEIEAIHLLLEKLSEGVRLQPQASHSDFQYVINLDLSAAPQLLRRGILGKGCRYWSGDYVVNRLADLILDFDQGVPGSFKRALPSMNVDAWRELLQKLSTRWSQDGGKSMRRHERLSSTGQARIEVGFEKIAHHLKVNRNNAISDENLTPEWRVNDASDAGMGLIYTGRAVDSLMLGRSIWVSQKDRPSQLGIIRRVQRLAEGGTRVGIELLGTLPLPVTLSESGQEMLSGNNGLYITQTNAQKGKRLFMAPKAFAEPGKVLNFAANGKSYQIRITSVIAPFEDCNQVEFETLERLNN